MKKTASTSAIVFTAAALAVTFPLAANAQNQNNQNNQKQPPNPLAPLGIRPGAIPLLGTGQYVIRGGQVVPVHPVVQTGGNTTFTPNPYPYGYGGGGGNTTVIINNNNGYPTYPYNNGYGSGYDGNGGGTSVYINGSGGGIDMNGSGSYNNGNYNNGYGINRPRYRTGTNPGYVSGILPNPNLVVPGTPLVQTVRTGGITTTTLFNGYAPIWTSGQTVLSPFGAFYGAPAYIGSQYIVATPYPYLQGRETVVLNGLIIVGRDGSVYASNGPQTGTQAPSEAIGAPNPDAAEAAGVSENKAALLRDALRDIRTFWVSEDVRALRRRLAPTGVVAVFQNEKFAYSVRRTDFVALSSDALDRIQTRSLTFKRVVARNDGLVNAYAAHTYRVRGTNEKAGGELRTATVRVTFAWDGSDWFVNAISFVPGSLASPGR